MNYFRTLSATLLLVAVTASIASAGAGNRVGTSGASELLIPVGTRDIGMGGATAATSSGIDALFWNPASVANMNNSVGLYVSHMSYIADIGVDYGAVAANFEGSGRHLAQHQVARRRVRSLSRRRRTRTGRGRRSRPSFSPPASPIRGGSPTGSPSASRGT